VGLQAQLSDAHSWHAEKACHKGVIFISHPMDAEVLNMRFKTTYGFAHRFM